MENNRTIRVDVSVVSPCQFDVQVVVPKYYQSYNLDNIGDMKLEDFKIDNVHLINIINHTHYEIDIPVPCVLNHVTVSKYWKEYVDQCIQRNIEIDRENKMNKRIPYEKYCAEQEGKGIKPSRLQYMNSHELSKYGYKEQYHVIIPSGEVVAWSVVEEFK